MTNEEKRIQMEERNAALCAYYTEGHKLAECSSKFKLGRQRVQQILEKAGVWKPYEKSKRDNHLGVTVTTETKEKLKAKADAAGKSVSRFSSEILEAAINEATS
jgi:hypothetical protein